MLLASRCTGNSVEDSNDASTTPFWQRVKDAVPKRLTTLTVGERRDRMALWQRGIHQLPTNVDVGTYARHARLLPILRHRGGADCSEQGCDVGKVDYAALTRKLGPDFAEALRENEREHLKDAPSRARSFIVVPLPQSPGRRAASPWGASLPKISRRSLPFPSTSSRSRSGPSSLPKKPRRPSRWQERKMWISTSTRRASTSWGATGSRRWIVREIGSMRS